MPLSLRLGLGLSAVGGNGASATLLSALQAYWPGDEASGSLIDAHVNDLDLSDQGGVVTDTGLVYAGARSYNGSAYHYHVDDAKLHVGNNDMSWCMWFKPATIAAGVRVLWAKDNGEIQREWLFYQNGNNIAVAFGNSGYSGPIVNWTLGTVAAGTWHCLQAYYRRNVDCTFTLGGRLDGGAWSTVVTKRNLTPSGSGFGIGVYDGGAPFSGLIGPTAFWKTLHGRGGALTSAQFDWLYNGGNGRAYDGLGSGPANAVTVFDVKHRLLVFDGDSITFGYNVPASSYPAQCVAALTDQSYAMYLVAIGGSTWAALIARAATSIDPIYDARPAKKIVCAMAGTNDLWACGTGAGAAVFAQVVAYCQARRAAGWQVIVLTMLPCATSAVDKGASFDTEQVALNAAIVAGWAAFADGMVDVASNANLSDANDTTYFYADKMHLNATGYGVVAGLVKTAIEAL
jgi:lysophospholipase L1-like esterase